jgi:hypothetical protein
MLLSTLFWPEKLTWHRAQVQRMKKLDLLPQQDDADLPGLSFPVA